MLAVGDCEPLQSKLAKGAPTNSKPLGSASVIFKFVITNAVGLVNVSVIIVDEPNGTVGAAKALLTVGGA